MWDYPIFAILLAYIWIELTNPVIAYSLQIIPKLPNSAVALIFCYMIRPDFIKQIRVPFNPAKWALPFLFLITINLPFVQYAQSASIIDVVSTWFWVLFLSPLMIRVLAIPSGRWHFIFFSTIGLVILSSQYYIGLFSGRFVFGEVGLTYHHLALAAIPLFPLLLGYLFIKKGMAKLFIIVSLIIMLVAVVPAGARSMWIIMPIQLIYMVLFVLPKSRLVISGIVVAVFLSAFLSFGSLSDIYSNSALLNLETRIRKTREWQEDSTVWKRFGMVIKTNMILKERPFLGVGYSNRSFASFDAGSVEFFEYTAAVNRLDAHNTYLNILGGTGILGFSAFLYYLWKIFIGVRKIPVNSLLGLESGAFIVAVVGMFAFYFVNTSPFHQIVYTSTLAMALHAYQFELQD
jgi:O-antigen ligase